MTGRIRFDLQDGEPFNVMLDGERFGYTDCYEYAVIADMAAGIHTSVFKSRSGRFAKVTTIVDESAGIASGGIDTAGMRQLSYRLTKRRRSGRTGPSFASSRRCQAGRGSDDCTKAGQQAQPLAMCSGARPPAARSHIDMICRLSIAAAFCLLPSAVAAGPRTDAAKLRSDAWSACVQGKTRTFAAMREPAETIVRAAFGRCAIEEAAFTSALRRVFTDPLRMGETPGDDVIDAAAAKVRLAIMEAATASVLEARVAAAATP